MTFRTVISSLALVSAMTLSGGAFAQAMIGDVTIPEANMGSFQEKCAAIASAQTESLTTPVENEADSDDTATGAVATGNPPSDDGDPASEDNLDALLASLTPEQCKEAGLVSGPVPATTQ